MILWMLETMLGATLLMLLVLAVRRPVAELFGAQWSYALWLLPVLVPLLPVPSFVSMTAAPITIIIPEMPLGGAAAAASVPEHSGSTELLLMLLALWAGGAVAFATWQQSTYSAFMLHLGPDGRRAKPPSFGGIRVVESDAVEGPVALGLFRRRIVVPTDFLTRYSAVEQRLALEHELVHHRRLDLLWNWIALGLLTLNWFNPIVHFAFRAFRADQELACDAAVTGRAPSQRHDYACALVKSASHPGLIAVCPLNHADMLKRRLRMMKKHRASWARTAGGAAALCLIGILGAAVATPGFAHPDRVAADVIMATQDRQPIIEQRDIDRLREKCGDRDGDTAIVCSDDKSRDPEVRAIVERTKKRVKAHIERTMPSKKQLEKMIKSAEQARIQVQRVDVDRQVEEAHEAMEESEIVLSESGLHSEDAHRALQHARIQLARIDTDMIHREAMAAAMAARLHIDHPPLSPEDMAELQQDLAKARREMEQARLEMRREMEAELRELREEMEREFPAQRYH